MKLIPLALRLAPRPIVLGAASSIQRKR
jgi:hypothetical protein